MKWKKMKKVAALLLAVALLVAMQPVLPGVSAPVYGAESTIKKYADREALLSKFDLDAGTSNKAIQAVYFGQNGKGSAQKWYIAGKDPVNGGLVLFAASPLGTDVKFSDIGSRDEGAKPYEDYWKCSYESGAPAEVLSNHYGGSYLRETLQTLETDNRYFPVEEQKLMKVTTIVTNDTKSSKNYTTTDKLYAAYGDFALGNDYYITVGTTANKSEINKGLRIELKSGPYASGASFWLRAPYKGGSYGSLKGDPHIAVNSYTVTYLCGVLPAFSLDLTSVLFASAAPAASEGAFALKDAFTFRYRGTNLGSAVINSAQSNVQVNNAPNETLLVVQNDSGAWAKKVKGTAAIAASDVSIKGKKLASFAGCKVWLETKDSATQMLKAVMATQKTADITITPGKHMTKTSNSGAGRQRGVFGPMQAAVYTADAGYHFPSGYGKGIVSNGIKVTRNSETRITVSGAPSANAVIHLKPATKVTIGTPKIKTSYTYQSVKLSWKKVKGAAGYQVYRSTSKKGKYKKVKTTKATSWTNRKLTTGKTYFYKVRAYKKSGKTVYSTFSKASKVIPRTKAPSFKLTAGNNCIKVSWKKVSGADGYRIYRAKTRNGSYKLIRESRSRSRMYTSIRLSDHHRYYYKLCSYKIVKGKKVNSAVSIVKSKKTR